MSYQIFGKGEQVFLLVHNAGGDHRFLAPQIRMLSAFGRVLAVDLPGHGKSQSHVVHNDTLNFYAEAILELCQSLNIFNVIGTGLNYGANVLIECANIYPRLFSKMVWIDPPLLMQESVKALVNKHIQDLRDPLVLDHAERAVSEAFLRSTEANQQMALEAFKQISAVVLASLYENLLLWDQNSAQKIKELSIPTLCILTDGALCSVADLLQHQPKIKIGKVVDSFYWATLEVPDQVNAMLKRFLGLD